MFYLFLTLFTAAIAAADQLVKHWASVALAGKTIVLIPGWLQLHYITNDGMALSMLSGGRVLFLVLTVLFLVLVVLAAVKKIFQKKAEWWFVAAITGGAIGNLIDRAMMGKVVDMICVPWFSTFNIADIFITLGAILLVVYILIWDKEFLAEKPKKEQKHDNQA